MLYHQSSDPRENRIEAERMKNARSESDITEKRFSTASSQQDLSSFTGLAKSRLTEKQNNKQEIKKNPNKPV